MVTLTINGESRTLDIPDDMPLLWVLRDELKLTGTKFGCGMALCGACTVHVDGMAMRSCSVPATSLDGTSITTIEGLDGPIAEALFAAWEEGQVVQCGYCQPGQIMAAAALLAESPEPGEADIDAAMSGNICRCVTYGRIRTAVQKAASASKRAEA